MGMTIPTWLMYLLLSIASLGPLVSPWPRWWIAYYGALLVCWVLMSVVDMRRAVREERQAEGNLARVLRQFRADPEAEAAAERDADAVHPALVEERLIIVARDKVDLYDSFRRDQLEHGAVTVIADRRRTDRRRNLELFIPERRFGERRHYDVSQLLVTQGWAELTFPKR
jgi:hypothetical protein